MPTRNVVLTDHQNALIDRLVASGRYQNASEAIRAGLRLLEADEGVRTLGAWFDTLLAEADNPSLLAGEAETVLRDVRQDVLGRHRR